MIDYAIKSCKIIPCDRCLGIKFDGKLPSFREGISNRREEHQVFQKALLYYLFSNAYVRPSSLQSTPSALFSINRINLDSVAIAIWPYRGTGAAGCREFMPVDLIIRRREKRRARKTLSISI